MSAKGGFACYVCAYGSVFITGECHWKDRSMMERGEVKPPRQCRHVPECELDRERVFSGYGDPTAAWHGTSSPTLPRNPGPGG